MIKTIKDILIVVCIILFVYTFAIQNFKIPSGSMEPTLKPGDQVLVNKAVYGWSIPRIPIIGTSFLPYDEDNRLTLLEFLRTNMAKNTEQPDLIARKPKIGEIVAFEEPISKISYVKRAVVTEGMYFFVAKSGLWVEDNPIFNFKEPEKIVLWVDEKERVFVKNPLLNTFNVENTNNNRELFSYKVENEKGLIKFENISDFDVFKVKPGYTFMIGDNRNNSKDSRFIGAIADKHLLGRLFYRFFEINDNSIGINNNRSF